MNSSRPKSPPALHGLPTANSQEKIAVQTQPSLFDGHPGALPGSLNDSAVVRGVLIQSIRKSGKSRAQIAEDISFLSGRDVTEISLNKFTAESRTDYRWPAELDRAFCRATGDDTLLRCRAELAGYRMIDATESDLLDLGKEMLRQKRAAENMALLERRLQGVDL
jgi:hypothetical protein